METDADVEFNSPMKSDLKIKQDVIAELVWDSSIDASQIGVEVNNGVVTLTGHLNSFAEKWYAERAVQRIAGTKALAMDVDITLPGSTVRSDTDIARTAENVLQWMVYWPKDAVKVMVEDGWITLTGELDLEYQRQAATDAVRHLMGVKGVSDQITLKMNSSLESVKSEIEAALNRRAKSDAKHILVKVNGGNVTLSGYTHSWYERELARHAAWGTPGVTNVVDELTVNYSE